MYVRLHCALGAGDATMTVDATDWDFGPGWCLHGCGRFADRALHAPVCVRWRFSGA